MKGIRRRVRLMAAIWIVFQAATLSAFVPRACCLAHEAASARPSSTCHDQSASAHCSMPHGGDAACAMHAGHGHAGQIPPAPPVPRDECSLRGTCGGPAAALFALLSTHGVLTDVPSASAEFALAGVALAPRDQLIRQFASPDAPPPRA